MRHKLSHIRYQIAKWRLQINGGKGDTGQKLSSAAPDVQNRAQRALIHWETQLETRLNVRSRRQEKHGGTAKAA